MSNFTFLTEEQYLGSDKLEILEKRGTKAAITDFSILLGAYVSNNIHIENDNSLEGRTGYYWTKSYNGRNDARAVHGMVLGTTAMFSNAMVGLAQLYRSHQSLTSPRTERVGKEQEMVSLK